MFWGLLYVGLVYNYVRRCSELPTLVIAFLLICPMALDISGIRSSVAYLIVMNFTLFLEKANVKRRCFYIVGVLTAATIHITSLFYLIFALKRNRTYRKDLIMIFIFILGSAILVYTPLLDVLVRMTGNAKLMKWFSSESIYTYPNFNGFISVAFFVVSQYLLSRWAFYIACKEKPIKNKKVCFSSIVTQYNLSKMMLLLLPLNMVAIESQRLLFGFFIIFYSLVSNVLITYNGMCYRKEKFYLFMTTVVFSILCMQMYMYSYSSHDVVGTLSKNLLFNM